jgi:hypothetical protein
MTSPTKENALEDSGGRSALIRQKVPDHSGGLPVIHLPEQMTTTRQRLKTGVAQSSRQSRAIGMWNEPIRIANTNAAWVRSASRSRAAKRLTALICAKIPRGHGSDTAAAGR